MKQVLKGLARGTSFLLAGAYAVILFREMTPWFTLPIGALIGLCAGYGWEE